MATDLALDLVRQFSAERCVEDTSASGYGVLPAGTVLCVGRGARPGRGAEEEFTEALARLGHAQRGDKRAGVRLKLPRELRAQAA